MSALQELYEELTTRLSQRPGNPCGDCRICCTAAGISVQNVQEVEYAELRERYGDEKVERFREFAERRLDSNGGFLHELCPFYDTKVSSCGIYDHRPFSCRIFGHFRMQGTVLPEPCVFRGHETEVRKGGYFREVPLARELRDLERRHTSHTPWRLSEPPPAPDAAMLARIRDNVDADDPLEMAVLVHLEGKHQQALDLFDEGLRRKPDAAYGHFYRGNLLEEMQRSAEALEAYQRAAELEPDNARFHLHLAIGLLEASNMRLAREAFARTVELDPSSGIAHGFLGYLLLAEGDLPTAITHLRTAVESDPDNPHFKRRLQEALARQGPSTERS